MPVDDDLEDALDALPLFPLGDIVLLPGVLLPLHVFEPRYRKMVRDVLDGHRSMGVVQVVDGPAVDEHGHPPIANVAGVGTVVDCVELSNGRYNIMLRGRMRVELHELPFVSPYRRAACRVRETTDDALQPHALPALLAAVTAFVSALQKRESRFEFRLPKAASPEAVINHCAQHLLIDGRDRQRILETDSLRDRAERLTEMIALQQLSFSREHGVAN